MSLIAQLTSLRDEAVLAIDGASTAESLESLRVHYLGKKGGLAALMRGLGAVPADERPQVGQAATDARAQVEAALDRAQKRIAAAEVEALLNRTPIDVTLPGRRPPTGHRHPLSQTLEDVTATFRRLGFGVAEGPQIELDRYNFEALNFPADHPARDMQDTFFVDPASLGPAGMIDGKPRSDVLLRTHTSPVQVRAMLSRTPPIRLIMPGSVFRVDSDPTHSPMFHQVEGLYVDKGVSFAHLKGTLDAFVRAMFGADRKIRLRPSFFPFVEPGAECDMSCGICGGTGCRTCKGTGWVEIMGCGLVHPNVLRACGIDPEVYSGFAFGFGIERIAMMRHGIDDLRHLFENDARFLQQF